MPVLPDWQVQGGPPLNLLFRPNHRRTPRVWLFIEFVHALVQQLQSDEPTLLPGAPVDLPGRHRRGSARASTILRWPAQR